MKKVKLISALLIVLVNFSLAQDEEQIKPTQLPGVSLGAGVFIFNGDVGKGTGVDPYAYIRAGYQLNIEERIHPMLGISFNGLFGSVAKSERSGDALRNKNFESSILQLGLLATFHFDNDVMIPKSFPIGPYISTGIAYVKFDPHGDLKGNNNSTPYRYWSDGSIRDQYENTPQGIGSQIMVRDYKYETQLKDSAANYARNTFAVPIHAGFKFKFSDYWDVNIGANYNITFSDYIDNVKDGGNDSYLYSYCTATYHIIKKQKPKEKVVNVDFASIDRMDSDHDGVIDVEDHCQGTPAKIKVDEKGCPLDDDGDGVPNYIDKQKYTPKGAVVDANGVTMSKKAIAEAAKKKNAVAAATERSQVFNQNPSLKFLENIDAQIAAKKAAGDLSAPVQVSERFKTADKNGDGIISSNEIIAAIDAFFEGDPDFTAEKLHALIDYFFEQ